MEKIKILLCDDMDYTCKYFTIILSKEEDFEIVGMTNNHESCMAMIESTHPDVVLLDIQMSSEDDGIVILEEIKEKHPEIKVIMLTIHEDDEMIFRALSGGACDFLLKSSEEKIIFDSIRSAYNGITSINPCIAQKLLSQCQKMKKRQKEAIHFINSVAQLTSTEYQILRLVYDGYSYSDIANQRFVADVTIRTQVNKILKKFGAKNMKELIKQLKDAQIFDMKE